MIRHWSVKLVSHNVTQVIMCVRACLREEREQRRSDIEHLATSLVGKVNECVQALDEGALLSLRF